VIFIDDYTKFTWMHFLKRKDEVSNVFASFKSQVENLLDASIKILRTDLVPNTSHFLGYCLKSSTKYRALISRNKMEYPKENIGILLNYH
jgi:hypothetical protein